MKKLTTISLSALAAASLLALAACGGGGGDSGGTNTGSNGNNPNPSNPGTPSTTVPGTLDSAQYPADSVQLAVFNQVNKYRSQCGFPTFQQNTILDQAAAAHASYGLQNNVIGDNETTGNPGFTGVTYADRAAHFGFPSSAFSTGVSSGFYTNATLSNDQYGKDLVDGFVSGVYHVALVTWPETVAGVGVATTTYNGFPQLSATIAFGVDGKSAGSTPLTFPCDGVTGIPYAASGERPTPPGTSGQWGTPIAVTGNTSDKVTLQSAVLLDQSGTQIALKMLDATTDPNKLLPAFEAVAYPVSALKPNSTYSATLNGTINGVPFTRTFSFTTGDTVG
ncbi:CAP domain-containing protein [Burkholderia pseudomallei]|uniref:CAP domain-containing protein n=1 Tax=Burkholderia pseudomallei TaxID=28450 RepID=UPI0005102C1D|nr:CAP domain-containing protein [Burkholderia pseudomallei]KGC96462.1 putative sCP-like extracellular [Burkholderia pseudomallei]KGD55087.1 putative sCP-like extracellular [Burkholderia pseudomallei]KGW78442.1 putative sCP-like extracellular [Burkholderia pseudomallei MSHR2990]KGW81021.1 putative sCP-like extracellular [Burkholderia pseudomallei MSHR456]MBF3522632.1 CAP domain-containing protein [Burkholderia pseudomallei]